MDDNNTINNNNNNSDEEDEVFSIVSEESDDEILSLDEEDSENFNQDLEMTKKKVKEFEKSQKQDDIIQKIKQKQELNSTLNINNLNENDINFEFKKLKIDPNNIEDFFRNYLMKNELIETLETFQNEFYEKKHMGTFDSSFTIPEIYLENAELENQVINLSKKLEEAQKTTSRAIKSRDEIIKKRNYYKLHHKRVFVEKEINIKELIRLRKKCESNEPIISQLRKKYELAMKSKMVVHMKRDKLQARLKALEISENEKKENGINKVVTPANLFNNTSKSSTSNNNNNNISNNNNNNKDKNTIEDYDDGSSFSSSIKKKLSTPNKSSTLLLNKKDSIIPNSDRINPFLSQKSKTCKILNKTFEPSSTLQNFHSGGIGEICIHPDKQIFASCSDDTTWKMYSIYNEKEIMTGVGHKSWVSGLDFHPYGAYISTSSDDKTVKIWDFKKGCCSHTFFEHSHTVWGVKYHDSGDFVLTCSLDSTAKLLDLHSLRVRTTLRGHEGSVNSATFKPYSNIVVTCSDDKNVSLWDIRLKSTICVHTFSGSHKSGCNYAVFDYQGYNVASSDSNGTVCIWDLRKKKQRGPSIQTQGKKSANKICFDPTGQALCIPTNQNVVNVYSTIRQSPKQKFIKIGELKGHQDHVNCCVFDSQGKFLVSSSEDNSVIVWS